MKDDILADLRAWRDEFARAHGYDLGAIAEILRKLDAETGNRVTRDEPRHPTVVPSPGALATHPSRAWNELERPDPALP